MIEKGTLVHQSQPFVYVVASNYRGLNCDFCLKRNDNLFKCAQCLIMSYCDLNCQRNAWEVHKHECLHLKNLGLDKTPCDLLILMARIICKLKFNGGNQQVEFIGNDIKRCYNDLESHVEDIENDVARVENIKLIEEKVKDLLSTEDLPTFSEFLQLVGKCQINGQVIKNDEDLTIGAAIYLGTSFFNHSCQPNAVTVSEGISSCVYLIEDIPVLDYSKIFVSYLLKQKTTEERRKELKRGFYFDCDCAKCVDIDGDHVLSSIRCENPICDSTVVIRNGPTFCSQCGFNMSNERVETAFSSMDSCKASLSKLKTVMKLNRVQFALSECDKILKIAAEVLHPKNIHYFRIVEIAYNACVSLDDTLRAILLAEIMVHFLKNYGGIYYPRCGLMLLKMGKYADELGDVTKARKCLNEGFEIINVTHSVSKEGLTPYREMLRLMDLSCER